MKKISLLVLALILIAGCNSREKLVERFKSAYPDTWEQKLLEYDIQRERDMWKAYQSEQPQKHYHYQPRQQESSIVYPQDNYWQEQRAKQEYIQSF